MFSAAGFDWIFIDTEHGGFTIEAVQDLVRTSLLTPITPIVRVSDLQYTLVARALDQGAEGILFPRVEDPERLAEAVSWAKYPPVGIRGYGLMPQQLGYQAATFAQAIEHINRETLIVSQVETQRALDCCDEMAAVPGVDVLLVGPADLSISLGVGGDFENPKLTAAIEHVVECCKRHGKWAGIQVRNQHLAETWMKKGIQLIGCSNEATLLWNAVKSLADDLQAARDAG
jgi:2-dehydro-3-deoxyglucarate aldolase/4-hydroxy-2-oxoheptanedioate aldolase